MRECPGFDVAFGEARNHPELVPVSTTRAEFSAEEFTAAVKEFALTHEADAVGITPMDPLYVFEGYVIEEPTVIMLAVAHNYERPQPINLARTNSARIARPAAGPVLRAPLPNKSS
jgi:epoxyqueuosine reductase